ncbi:hypothetical protein BT69DRAFT_1379840 [Atractiella rhizophila]|nr:hypothetical protein BT69DRAFT_1379840 [Atractiella rhizophila]
MTSSQPILIRASLEQYKVAFGHSHASWGGVLNSEEYVEREMELRNISYSQKGKLQPWVLVPADDPTTLNPLSGCKTFRGRALISLPSTLTTSSELCEVDYCVVYSVYTPLPHRGKGYASLLFSSLHEELKTEGVQAMVLFADVEGFYERFGYVEKGNTYRRWEVASKDMEAFLSSTTATEEQDLMPIENMEDIRAICATDAQLVQTTVLRSEFSKPRLYIPPTGDEIEYFITRASFDHVHRFFSRPKPSIYGARVSGSDSFVLFYYDFRYSDLRILRLRCEPEEFPKLLKFIVARAMEMGMKGVEVWELKQRYLEGLPELLQVEEQRRGDSRNMLCWFGPPKLDASEIDWVSAERYSCF